MKRTTLLRDKEVSTRTRSFLYIALVIVILMAAVLVVRYVADERYRIQEDDSPVQVALSWEGRPGLGRTLTLTARVTSRLPADEIEVSWVVPADLALAGGPARETLGPIAPGQTLTSKRQVTLEQVGQFHLAAGAQVAYGAAATFVGADELYLTVAGGPASSISRNGPRIRSTVDRLLAPDATVSSEPSPDGGFYVRGQVMYEDITISPTDPITQQTLLPARQIEVEIWEEDSVFDDFEGSVLTDDNGRFEFRVRNNDDGVFGGDKEIYVVAFASNTAAWVTDRTFIDQRYSCRSAKRSGGHDIDFGRMAPESWHRMFNLADAALTVRRHVVALGGEAPKRVKIQYEPGYGETTSHYDPQFGEIDIADKGDDDGYDDCVLMHEYGHFLTDNYSCEESPGGEHSATAVQNSKLSWSEGFADFISSAARGSSYYLDYKWSTHRLGLLNWEPWGDDPAHPVPKGQDVEGNITAILWDIYDWEAEPHDRVYMSDEEIWHVVESHMDGKDADHGEDACNLYGFYSEWVGVAPDSDSAAIFRRYGVNYEGAEIPSAAPTAPAAVRAAGGAPDEVFVDEVPWRNLVFLLDGTQSMDNEIEAVKAIVQDRVSELDAEPNACQYTVETFADSLENTPVVDDFFPDVVNPAVAGITVGGGGDREEGSLHAILKATLNRKGSNVWLFTDGAAKELGFGKEGGITGNSDPNGWVNELARRLRAREVTPYMFIFGQCDDENNLPREKAEQIDLQACIEPYLRTASATGGQFLFLDTSQVADATEVVRTLMVDNAVSGHFAHTVHDTLWTYEWDDTEYAWFDTTISGTHHYVGETPVNVLLPMPFTFYGAQRAAYYLTRPGYITFAGAATVDDNTSIPNPAAPNNAIYAFWDNMDNIPAAGAARPDGDMGVYTYWGGMGGDPNRYYIEYHQNVQYATGEPLTFEIILQRNPDGLGMDEIVVQYQQVGDSSSTTVGTENADGSLATQVVANMADYIYPGRALKFTPIPPGPRDHLVPVDEYMESASFFMNGYQGSVDLALFRPDGTPVSTGDPDVTYYSIGMVEFYKIASPAAGTWRARVSGSGTYYFTSSAVTDWKMKSLSERTLSMGETTLVMDLGLTTTLPTTFTLVNERGVAAAQLALLDDGNHGDGEAGDGVFGGLYQPTAPGTLYLQVEGLTPAGYPFRRLDPVPFTFQPMNLSGGTTTRFLRPDDSRVTFFRLDNDDTFTRTYDVSFESTQGWVTPTSLTVTVPAGGMRLLTVNYHVPIDAGDVVDELTMSAVSYGVADAASYVTVIRRATDLIDLLARPMTLAPGGDQAVVQAFLVDALEYNVADGTRVTFSTTLGTIAPTSTTTLSGAVRVTLTTGAEVGLARVVAEADGVTAAITLVIEIAPPQSLTLSVADGVLPPDGISTTPVTAHVYDRFGQPAQDGTTVIFVVDGDDMAWGSLLGVEAYTTTTSAGLAMATYRSGTQVGSVTLRAMLAGDGPPGEGDYLAGPAAQVTIRLSYGLGYEVYLPIVCK